MPPDASPANVTLQIVETDQDADELDRMTRQLRDEIQDLDVGPVELVREGTAPQGAKAAEIFTLGSLAVSVLPAAVPKLVEFLQSWAMRGEARKIKIKTQVGDRSVEVEYSPQSTSPAELKNLVETLASALTPKS